MTRKNNTVYIITGPTAVGKSSIAFYLAKRIGGEIVNCDSIQLYKYMDIGSAKPSGKELRALPHHLYSIVEPEYNLTVAEYQKLALEAIDEILRRGRTPIVTGGTGLYLHSILYQMDFAAVPGDNGARRRELEAMAEKMGATYMYEYLSAIDPAAAERIHPNNIRKVVRAIEAFETGTNVLNLEQCERNTKYDFRFFGLTMDRERLYERINRRVIKLIKLGLIEEVQGLKERGLTKDTPSMKAIGYKEVLAYLDGEMPLKEMIYEIMKNTRRYAKRQLTWMKRYEGMIHWVEITQGRTVGSVIDEILAAEQE